MLKVLVSFVMKLKILTALLLSTAMSVLSPLNAEAGAGCSNYPFKPGESKFVPKGDGQYMFLVTEQSNVSSRDYKKISSALFSAEILAEARIRNFIEFSRNSDWDDWTTYKENMSRTIYGIIKVGSCYEPKKFVRVTLGISPNTISAHKEDFPYLLDRTPVDKDLFFERLRYAF